MTDAITPKNAVKFACENCNFKCCKKSDWDRHLLTLKHNNTDKILTNTDDGDAENASLTQNFICICGKGYKHRQSLFNHKKNCQNKNIIKENDNNDNNNNDNNNDLVKYLMKENSELKTMILDVCKNINMSNQTNCNNISNSNNKTFNLNVFLNETCKDAMNIMDFVDSLKLQLSDLENLGKIGYVEGISSIIVKNLNSLDETMRPVHCTDSKREVMYVKDENKWEKENENNQKLRKAIKSVVRKNSKLLNDFRAKHPDCCKSDSRYSDQYNKLVVEAFGGKGDNDIEKEDKIIKNIVKQVTINKESF
jgi:hypothetical protein